MKVKKIILKDYNQFKKLELDLTYPSGHPKVGKPLDKICFIGQSGTGKTSLLRLIKYLVSYNSKVGFGIQLPKIEQGKVLMDLTFENIDYTAYPGINKNEESGEETSTVYISNCKKDNKNIKYEEWLEYRNKFEEKVRPRIINYPTESQDKYNLTDDEIKEKTPQEIENYLESLIPNKIIDFSYEDKSISWNYVLKDIKHHRAKELMLKQEIADIALNRDSKPNELSKVNRKYQNWIKKNPDPLALLSEKCLNPILNKLGLKVKMDIDYETILSLNTIEIQTLLGKEVNRNFWSTGTKHIIDTAIPLFELKPQNAVILMDEPEKSLYPDLQENIIDFYIQFTSNCQFFFATHSPVIAASFDPWEIIELRFDKNNEYAIQNLLWSGERHIDNFKFHPKYLRWDAILMKVFDVKDEGNSKHRENELLNYLSLKGQLEKMKKEGKTTSPIYKNKFELFIASSKKLGWDNEKN